MVNHLCRKPQTSFIKLSPHWPPQRTKLGILWLGLNINLCHSRATGDSQAHSRVFCGEFGANLAKYSEGFYYYKPIGLWWPLCSRIEINLTEFHQRKVIQEIILVLHLCVAVPSGPVDWHWLWGIACSYDGHLLVVPGLPQCRWINREEYAEMDHMNPRRTTIINTKNEISRVRKRNEITI